MEAWSTASVLGGASMAIASGGLVWKGGLGGLRV